MGFGHGLEPQTWITDLNRGHGSRTGATDLDHGLGSTAWNHRLGSRVGTTSSEPHDKQETISFVKQFGRILLIQHSVVFLFVLCGLRKNVP
jgi:hypothetical protein